MTEDNNEEGRNLMEESDDLFKQLSEDEDIVAALAEHDAVSSAHECSLEHECPACLFFNHVHVMRHLVEDFDPVEIAQLADNTSDFLADAMAISVFFSVAAQDYLEFIADMQYEDEEEGWDEDEHN